MAGIGCKMQDGIDYLCNKQLIALTLSDNKEFIWIFRTLEISTYFEQQKHNMN